MKDEFYTSLEAQEFEWPSVEEKCYTKYSYDARYCEQPILKLGLAAVENIYGIKLQSRVPVSELTR